MVKRKRESSPSPSSSSTRQPKYEVFLSFRGEDTRTNFTDHLYVALKREGIITFRDEEELEKGERISELFKAIEESQFAIVILSRNYASSTWCLDELIKIIKCMDEMGLKVLPVFYDVGPTVVRKQTETFEQAFIDHQKRFEDNIEKVETWRDTLKKVADISGWDLHQQNRHESEIIQHIVKGITEKLSPKSSSINKNLIGIKSMVAKLIPSYLGFGNDIYMMGICGMGGLGKTTLATAIHDKYLDHFEGCSIIADVRERSGKGELHKLQEQLLNSILGASNTMIYNVLEGVKNIKSSRLHNKKILLVLDDVDDKNQLENLAGEPTWFGLGSWIIITTRDERVLVQHGGLKIYKPNGLDYGDASTLFCLKAFKKEQPEEGYMQLSQKVVEYASGLPLALVTLGSFLVGRAAEEWQSALDSLKNIKGDMYKILKISYDGLDEMWKEIFLDIVCFFRGEKKDEVIQILENCGFHARIGVSVLVERSLLTVDYEGRFGMHDLLSEMGQKIIHFESGGKLGKQSRLWLVDDLLHVLENDMATEAIQAIVVRIEEEDFNFEEFSEEFSKMSNLRLLIILDVLGHFRQSGYHNDQRHLALPNNLRHLSWSHCPFKCLASSDKRKAFVQLHLHCSKFEYLWDGVMRSVNLKFIDLSCSKNLIRTSDLSGAPRLERLNLFKCDSLVEIHPSIGHLSGLRYLDLRYCSSLTNLPTMSAKMQSLTVLDLFACTKFSSIPKFTGIVKSLSELKLSWTAIKKVEPSSIECLTALTLLDLSYSDVEFLPSNMDKLRSLEKLILCGCSKLKSLPRLPSTIRYINADFCYSLKWTPTRAKLSNWSQPLSQWCPYDETGSQVEFRILFHFLQGHLCRKTFYGTSFKREEDGSRTEFQIIVPSCLTHTVGNSIIIKLPSNWYNSKWIGFALLASALGVIGLDYGIRARVIFLGDMPQNHCASELLTTWICCEVNICLLYLSRDDWFATVGNNECSQIKVIFETEKTTMYVWECGVSLIYEQDVDEFNQKNAQCLIESFGEKSICKFTVGDDDGDDNEDEDEDEHYEFL
ncbi:TMV resistance protein N-like [Quercus lobata]|uniref:ADP-ribosyl cyclase/cyclic ADP-ribose hydrolase n=1 Tax=Quercus lobata TaxID=97700 RepID=A0A7N2R789_QUELO|nr:TMV resistance protein N-like [Quercus lobata]XP_030925610.1 TMV resistance protein N-like [Quercus lobata]XP_030925611.1 TMV resistance protein N-like [Quercus lobata]